MRVVHTHLIIVKSICPEAMLHICRKVQVMSALHYTTQHKSILPAEFRLFYVCTFPDANHIQVLSSPHIISKIACRIAFQHE
jgi:hypothetical protein